MIYSFKTQHIFRVECRTKAVQYFSRVWFVFSGHFKITCIKWKPVLNLILTCCQREQGKLKFA